MSELEENGHARAEQLKDDDEADRQSNSTRNNVKTLRENGDVDVQEEAAMEQQGDTSNELSSTYMSRSASEASTTSSSDDEKILAKTVAPKERVSIYVQVFEEMLNTVLEHESHLFNEEELEVLARFKQMSYPARYLFVRLFARKNGWFRVARLGYHDELVDVQAAVDEICNTIAPGEEKPASAAEDPHTQICQAGPSGTSGQGKHETHSSFDESIVITIESDEEEACTKKKKRATDMSSKTRKQIEKGKGRVAVDPMSNRPLKEVKKEQRDFGLTRFAINEQILAERNDVDELLSLLSLDELKVLGKDLRIPSNFTTRPTIIEAIKRNSSNQSTITSMFATAAAKTKAKAEGLLANLTNKGRSKSSDKARGKEREMEKPAGQPPKRQIDALAVKILQHLGSCIKLESAPIRLFARLHLLFYRSVSYSEKTLTQAVLARFKIRNYPSYAVKRSFSIFENRQALVDYEDALILERRIEELTGEAVDSSVANRFRRGSKEEREKDMREALAIFEQVYPKWKEMVKVAKAKDVIDAEERKVKGIADDKLTYYRKRFLAGWPLTRVVYKGATILARLHEYNREVEVMESLLEQNCFRRGKRGEWYDRLALLYMHHHSRLDQSSGLNKTQYQEKALKICYEGLNHPWSHLIYHNSLARRIVRLESALDVLPEERHPPVPSLRIATKRVMKGEQLYVGETGRKTIWRSQNGCEVSVEDLSLEQYKREGWNGYHSENGILTTIFALLFWDVIFAPIDGVFETAYQAGPLDLSTDAFAIVRAELVAERLQQIEDGQAPELLQITDERERENKTYCVGLKWGYEREDLLEIIQCFTPKALKTICRVYAEEWSHRVGGVPDLFLWNIEKKICRFVEVKGPGDFLSETQKIWIDVLLSAEVSVELCSVQQIFEEDYLSLSDVASPRKTKISASRKSKSSNKKEELTSDDASDAKHSKPIKHMKLPTPRPSPSLSEEDVPRPKVKKRKSDPSYIAPKEPVKRQRSTTHDPAASMKNRKVKPAINKRKRSTRSIATEGSVIVLSD